MVYLSRLPSRRDKEKRRCNVDEDDKRSGGSEQIDENENVAQMRQRMMR